ncbi:hypothetical protein DRJ16_05020 [Candidatus Woesearchaeota archaeon]|nr:MAG: hypothetical protein DRJ16_05020 [Candidatus Woesearchaeota archaeon]
MPLSATRVLLHPPKRYVLSFDGENDYIEVADDPSLRLESFTLMAWFYRTREGYYERIIARDDPGFTNYILQVIADGRVQIGFHTEEGENIFTNSFSTIPLNTWACLAGTWDNDSKIQSVYVNGNLDRSLEKPGKSPNIRVGPPTRIGRYGDFYGAGLVAFALIYNRALSATEIRHNYLNPMSPVTDGLVLWLKMEEGSGTTVHDYSGYGNDGTIYGATWKEITHDPVRTLSPVRVLSNVR